VRVPAARARPPATGRGGLAVHASIWKFNGDPDALLERYDAMLSEIGAGNLRLHICLRAVDGIVLVDTCPSKEAYEAFAHGDAFRELRERHGLPEPFQLDDTRCTSHTRGDPRSIPRERHRCERPEKPGRGHP
jgi:hypothetical protein